MAELTVGRLLTSWQPYVPALLLVMVLGGLYALWFVVRAARGRAEQRRACLTEWCSG